MPLFAIPILILVAIFAITAGGDLLKNVDLPLLDFHLFPEKKEGQPAAQRTTAPRPSTISQAPSGPSPPDTSSAQEPETTEPTPEVSPFFEKVDIASARASSESRSSLITLRPKIANGETLDITGWKIEGRNGSFTIPLGVEKFEPGIQDNPVNPIILTRADTVKLSSERSPFGLKRNFRPNICMGYLKDDYDFDISFSTSCSFQKPLERELLFLPEHCQDFILKSINFSSCRVPQYPEDPNILQQGSAECASYLQENFTYHTCFKAHQNEPNFTKNEWHIYMNTDFINPRYDLLKLYDNNGLLIDTKELL